MRYIYMLLALGACTTQQQAQFAQVVVAGQLICKQLNTQGASLVALADASGAPISVIGKSSTWVAAACAVVNGTPVPLPATPTPIQVQKVTPPSV